MIRINNQVVKTHYSKAYDESGLQWQDFSIDLYSILIIIKVKLLEFRNQPVDENLKLFHL
jgi:hypothetical protein